MKKYVKRFLAVFPAVLILILTIIPFSAFGAGSSYRSLYIPDDGSCDLKNLTPELVGINESDSYIFMKHNNGDWAAYFVVVADGKVDILNNPDGTITYTFYGSTHFAGTVHYNSWSGLDGWDHRYSTLSFTFDPVKSEIISTDFFGRALGVTPFQVTDHLYSKCLEVDDTIYPDFSQNPVSRFIDGFSMDYGQIDVKNSTNDDYYIAMFIVQSNKDVDFIGNTSLNSDQSGKCWTNADGDILFPFATDEYFFTKSNSLNNKVYQEDVGQSMFKVYAPSAVHPLKAGKSYSFYFGFNQVNLVKNHTYDLVLYAYAPYEGQNIHSLDFCPNVFEYINMKEVYRRTFTMAESTPYDSNRPDLATAQGTVYGFNSYNPDATFDSINGFEINHDPDSSLGGSSYKPIKDSFSNLQYSYGNGSYNFTGGSSGANFSSLIPVTSNYFNFLAVSLGYFPSIFIDVVSLALISFLVIAIIRRLH